MCNERNMTGGGTEGSTPPEKKYTSEDLKIMQGWDLDRKIQVTQTRIIEWYEKWNGQVYVSFSGGKDSTVLLDLVRRIYSDVLAVFIDTGLEYPEIRQFVKGYDNVEWLRPEMNFRKVIETYGYPLISKEVARDVSIAKRIPNGKTAQKFVRGSDYHKKYGDRWVLDKWRFLLEAPFNVSNKCCTVMKKNPAHKFDKSTGLKPIIATMACESALRKNDWMKSGCNAFDSKNPASKPLSFWTEQDVLEYVSKYIKPKYCRAWNDAQYSSGSERKKARKFLRRHAYSKTGIAPVYGDILYNEKKGYYTSKCDRTGCCFCGFGAHLEKEPNRFQRLKQTHPKLWNYCMKPWDQGGLGMKKVLEFINVKNE